MGLETRFDAEIAPRIDFREIRSARYERDLEEVAFAGLVSYRTVVTYSMNAI